MKIELCGYHLKIDKKGTEAIYDQIKLGGSEECTCDYCKNYALIIDSVFPAEIVMFFGDAGIDKIKDAEVYQFNEERPGVHHYGGEYYFLGSVLNHPKIPAKIGSDFNFAFTEPSPLVQEEFRIKNAICFTFDTMIPWELDNV